MKRLLLLLSLAACSGSIGPSGAGGGVASGGGSQLGGGGQAGGGGTAGGGGVGQTGGGGSGLTSSEFPCEVARVLQETCQQCHGAPLQHGAPLHLITREDLLAASNINTALTVAERSVFRMRASGTAQMPPPPSASIPVEQIDAFEGWVTSGMPAGSCNVGTGGSGGGGTGGGGTAGGGSGTGGGGGAGGGFAFTADTPATYVAKVKQVLLGQAPTDAELLAVTKDAQQLGALVDGWMQQPAYQQKMRRFFQLAFQQTQVTDVEFRDQLSQGQLLLNNTDPRLVQGLQEVFARTMLELNAQHQPFTRSMTTTTFMLSTAMQTFFALRDVWQPGNDTRGADDLFKAANPTLKLTISASSGPIPLAQTLDPHHANYMHWYDPNVLATCGADPYVTPARANTLYHVIVGGLPNVCGAHKPPLRGQLTAADYDDWKLVTVRAPVAGEVATAFYDLATMRSASQTELLLNRPYVGFFSMPAFFANWSTNASNQARVTLNQTLIVATGTQVDGTDTTVPTSTPGLDSVHANDSACVYCHQTLDPTRSLFAATYSWNYGAQPEAAFRAQKGLFAYRGVQAPVNDLADFGGLLATHPLFDAAWVQKLCYWVNSQACDPADPEFQRLAGVFKGSSHSWNALVKAFVTSPLVTHAEVTRTATTQGVAIALARRDHLCSMWNSRFGLDDVCSLDASKAAVLPKTAKSIIPGLPSDGYSRGGTVPVLPNDPSLFYRSGLENLCLALAALLVDNANPPAGAKAWSSKQSSAAIAEFVSVVAGLPSSDPRASGLAAALTKHYDDARATGATATNALRSTFTVACTSPTAAALGL